MAFRPQAPQPQRILLIRPSALGDVCRSVCVLASLRRAYPDAQTDWLVQDDFAAAVAAHPALSQIVPFPRARLAHWWRSPVRLMEMRRWFAQLRRRKYDLVLDCQGLGRSGLMTFATGAPSRVGLRQAREFAWLGYNVRLPHDPAIPLPVHTVDQMMLLIEELGLDAARDMRLYLEPEHEGWWERRRAALGIDGSRYAVLAPTARWPSKRWPIERFGQLLDPLRQRGFEKVLIIGSPGETEQVRPLTEAAQHLGEHGDVIDLVGQTTIGQTMAVIAQAGLVVANDSAPLHIAVGFDRPCVGLFGPTDPAVVGPYQRADAVVRGYQPRRGETINFRDSRLGDSLMRFISTTTVIQRIDRVLALARQAENAGRAKPQAATEAKMNAAVPERTS